MSNGSANCIASTYYASSNFTIDVNLTDGNQHRIALYLLDWDSTRRAETISIVDPSTNTVLNAQPAYSSFNGGVYAVYNIQGHVQIKVQRAAGANAVLSGIFFDTPASTASVIYGGSDPTTQGNWSGTYGGDGYLIANDATAIPSYASVSLTGDNPYTWVHPSSANCPRALEVSTTSSNNCIASTYYSPTEFNINLNLTDANTHKISLYLLDWDSTLRAESVKIIDAKSNGVLFSATFSGFHNGIYQVFLIKGDVIIQVARTGGGNAVVGGIFFQ